MGNEENGEFQISLLSGWWAVFTAIKDREENVLGRKPRVQFDVNLV